MKNTIAAAEQAELKNQLRNLRLDQKAVTEELKTIAANERTTMRTLKRIEADLRREKRNVDRRRKSITREFNADRKAANRRLGKIVARIAIVKGRL